ncbi:MAG: hypothetical protein L6M37_04805 [Candidatus Methylarchaceae archaeon HK02M1]|nr:hypothetical protein [Candidatus Methylarchaceae archaeon HK02M1]
MIESKLKTDLIVRYLIKRSAFTKVQLDTYLIDCITSGEKISLKMKIEMRDKKNVSKGAFLRTLKQAQENLQKAIYTLILAEYMGILEEGATIKLIQIGNLLKNRKKEITKESAFKISRIIESVVDMLSGRKR